MRLAQDLRFLADANAVESSDMSDPKPKTLNPKHYFFDNLLAKIPKEMPASMLASLQSKAAAVQRQNVTAQSAIPQCGLPAVREHNLRFNATAYRVIPRCGR